MIIDDLHVVTMAIAPDKTDSPLIVDSNGVLSFSLAAQSFQSIPRGRGQNSQLRGRMQLQQFPQGDSLEGTEALAVVVLKKLPGFLRAKTVNHTYRVLRWALYVKRISISGRVEQWSHLVRTSIREQAATDEPRKIR